MFPKIVLVLIVGFSLRMYSSRAPSGKGSNTPASSITRQQPTRAARLGAGNIQKNGLQSQRKATERKYAERVKSSSQINDPLSDRPSVVRRVSSLSRQLEDVGLSPQDTKFFITKDSEPMAVSLWRGGDHLYLQNRHFPNGRGHGKEKVLNLADQQSIQFARIERDQESARLSSSGSTEFDLEKATSKQGQKIRTYKSQMQMVDFKPGLRDDKSFIELRSNPAKSLQGPDHDVYKTAEELLEELTDEYFHEVKNRTISLGHGGEVTLRVKNGYIVDRDGYDFKVFENPFVTGGGYIYQEFAAVGVATVNRPEAYRWFSCNPSFDDKLYCAGVMPKDAGPDSAGEGKGGDKFDLAVLGVTNVRYVKIRDTGLNQSNFGVNTEGFDLDAVLVRNFSRKKGSRKRPFKKKVRKK